MSLSKHELKLAGILLAQAAEETTRRGCNDFLWPEFFPSTARQDLVRAMAEDDHYTPLQVEERVQQDTYGKYGPPDWWVMMYLAKRLQEE